MAQIYHADKARQIENHTKSWRNYRIRLEFDEYLLIQINTLSKRCCLTYNWDGLDRFTNSPEWYWYERVCTVGNALPEQQIVVAETSSSVGKTTFGGGIQEGVLRYLRRKSGLPVPGLRIACTERVRYRHPVCSVPVSRLFDTGTEERRFILLKYSMLQIAIRDLSCNTPSRAYII